MHHAEPEATRQARRARFEALHRVHARALLALAVRRARGPEDAADIVADTFLVAWRRLDDVPAGDEARLWLYGVARRVAANHRRGNRRRDHLGAKLAEAISPLLAVTDETAATDNVSAVRAALGTLPAADREVLQLVAWEGLTAVQVGAVLGVPAATVRTRLHRARRRLRAAMPEADDGVALPPRPEHIARTGHDTTDEPPLVRETEAQP